MKKNKPVAIVTGSSRGLGAATAKMLAKRSYNIVVNYSQSEAEAREEIGRASCRERVFSSV